LIGYNKYKNGSSVHSYKCGMITVKKKGKTTITVSCGGQKAKITVIVK